MSAITELGKQFRWMWKTDLSKIEFSHFWQVVVNVNGWSHKSSCSCTFFLVPLLSSSLLSLRFSNVTVFGEMPNRTGPTLCYGSLAISVQKPPSSKTLWRQARHPKYCCVITRDRSVSPPGQYSPYIVDNIFNGQLNQTRCIFIILLYFFFHWNNVAHLSVLMYWKPWSLDFTNCFYITVVPSFRARLKINLKGYKKKKIIPQNVFILSGFVP